jgi:hypothetical protein
MKDLKENFKDELECVFDKFPNHHITILLGYFKAKIGRDDISKLIIRNETIYVIIDDSGVRAVNFVTSNSLSFKRTMLQHNKIHKYTWTSPDGKTAQSE